MTRYIDIRNQQRDKAYVHTVKTHMDVAARFLIDKLKKLLLSLAVVVAVVAVVVFVVVVVF